MTRAGSFITSVAFVFVATLPLAHAKKTTSPITIRVLLKELDAQSVSRHIVSSKEGFVLENTKGLQKYLWKKQNHLILTVKNNKIYLRGHDKIFRHIKNDYLSITPIRHHLYFDTNIYHGTLVIRIDHKNKKLLLINNLNLDDYIYSVLRHESLSWWPHEMQKVQAVASRSYAVHQIKQSRKKANKGKLWDIRNSNFHQVYQGTHNCTHLRKAVEETKNSILTYKGNVALTMFDICCGGLIPHHMKFKDSNKPYLWRKRKCTFCKGKQGYTWQEKICSVQLLRQLKKHPQVKAKLQQINRITRIAVRERDKAGIAYSIAISEQKKTVVLTINELRSCLEKNPKSIALKVRKIKNDIVFNGYGWGHNVGLCQLGAREMVRKGWGYKKILSYYYPGTKFGNVKKI